MTHRMPECSHELDGRTAWTGWDPAVLPSDIAGLQVFRRQCRMCFKVEEMPFMAREQCDNDCTFC